MQRYLVAILSCLFALFLGNAVADSAPVSRTSGKGIIHPKYDTAKRTTPRFTWGDEQRASSSDPVEAAREHLGLAETTAEARLSALSTEPDMVVMDVHDTGRGPLVVRFKNRHNGVDVLGSNTAVVMNRQGGLVAISGATLNAEQAAASVSALTVREWGLSSKDAIAQAMEHMGHTEKAAWHYENARGDFEVFKSPGRARPVRVKRMYVPGAAGMTAAYYVETGLSVSPEGVPRAFAYLISAEDGTVLGRDNLVDDYQAYNYRVFTDTQGVPFEDPYGRNQPHPTGTPDGFIPTIPAPQQLISVAEISERVDDPWLPDGATETVGNNVDAFYNSIIKEDGEFDLFFIDPASSAEFRPQDGDFRAQITGPNTFDYTYDELDAPNDYIQLPPTDPDDPIPNTGAQLNAKIVNAFYVNNYLHDIFYDAGLDEAAGVAQTDNFGRGGIDGDPIKVMAGFAFGTFIATLGEGISPEMFMGHNGASLTARDSTLDNQVIGHEFGHYAVRRLVGRDVGFLTTSQARALNEGWSDFIGLFIMVDPEDGLPTVDPAWNGTFGVGAYTNRDYEFFPGFPIPVVTGTAAFDTYYHGVRRYPYTVDLNRNPLTLRMIADGEPLPDDVPIFDWKGRSRYNTEVHSAGEVWTAALWQCYNSILNGRTRLSFDEKQKRFVEYLVAGMKALPFNPTYTEARDGLLAVMKANDRRDYHLCRIAMAERGFGAGAISPVRDSRDLTGVKESFSKSEIAVSFIDAALDDSINSNDNDGILDAGETGLLTVTLRNSGFKNLRYVFAKLDRSPAYRTSRFGFMLFKRAAPGEDMTAQIPIRLLDDTQFANTDFKLRLLGLTRFFSPERDFEFAVNTHFNLDRVSAADDAEDAVAFGDWAVSIDDFTEFHPADPRWKRRLRDGNFVYQTAEGFAGYNSFLTSPELNVSLTEDFVINFDHAYKLIKEFDPAFGDFKGSGLIEISNDGGASWMDLPSLVGQGDFFGTSAGYPGFTAESINLGTMFAGETVQIRFNASFQETFSEFYTDGWFVDNIRFDGINNTPFTQVLPDGS